MPTRKKKNLLKLIIVVLVATFVLAALFVWRIINEPPPTFFPLDNPQARYTIVRSSTLFQGWVEGDIKEYSDSADGRFYVEYRGEGVFNDEKGGNFFRITIGKSKIDLEPFINKDVSVKGKFTTSSKQCIVNECVDIYGPYVVLDIDSIQEAN